MAQATSSGKNVINLREWLGMRPKKAKKHWLTWDERNERRVDRVLEEITSAINKVNK